MADVKGIIGKIKGGDGDAGHIFGKVIHNLKGGEKTHTPNSEKQLGGK